jgi:hypothetical protein
MPSILIASTTVPSLVPESRKVIARVRLRRQRSACRAGWVVLTMALMLGREAKAIGLTLAAQWREGGENARAAL